ncbi:MAG TPA: aminomethyl transferase family protein [Candidatus Avidesulfovibrio excrementigallinarum]|nr:aminomethyl transferase family protein [Candidatus Avidesulfovibrio excrementigallinarum]
MLHQTALHAEHERLGATLVDFGGWDMPLWYPTGAVKEHLAVIQHAGLFDIGHMAGILVTGADALKALQQAFTKDISGLAVGRAGYGAFLNEQGCVLDDALVYVLPEGRYLVVLNVGHGEQIATVLRDLAAARSWDVSVRDLAGTYAKLDLQGPASVRVMKKVLADPEAVFAKMPYFSFKGDIELDRSDVRLNDGTPIFLSRTGYTGEQGFEIFVPYDRAEAIWRKLLEAGKDEGVIPCGLAARDSVRAGAVLPLSGQDIGPWPFINNPWPFTLPHDDKGGWTKDFTGREALEKAAAGKTAPYTYAYCGFDPRKVTSQDHHVHPRVLLGGEDIGDVLTCVADVSIGRVDGVVFSVASPDKPEGFAPKGLVCGFVRVDRPLEPGTKLTLADARRRIEVELVQDIRPARTARKALGSL